MSRTGNIKARVVATVFAIALINGLQHSLSPVLSSVHAYYPGVDVSLIQMLVTVPTLMAVVVALLTGWLALYISKKKIFLFAALVAGVATSGGRGSTSHSPANAHTMVDFGAWCAALCRTGLA